MDGDPPVGVKERPLQHLNLVQLKVEKQKLEKYILDLPTEGFGALREQLERSLLTVVSEIQLRKSDGQSLDQAQAKHRNAAKAKQLAEQQLQRAQDTLKLAQDALHQATEAEMRAAAELTKVRNQIATEETQEPLKNMQVGPALLAQIYGVLQQVGVAHTDVSKIAHILGANFPPPPPAAPPQAPAATAAVAQQAAQASHLASQLLTQDNPQAQARVGRSPAPKRKPATQGRFGGLCLHASHFCAGLEGFFHLQQRCFTHARQGHPTHTSGLTAGPGNSAGCTLTHPTCDAQTRRWTALHALQSRGRRSCTARPLDGFPWCSAGVPALQKKRRFWGFALYFQQFAPRPLSQWSVSHLCLVCLSGIQSTFAHPHSSGYFFSFQRLSEVFLLFRVSLQDSPEGVTVSVPGHPCTSCTHAPCYSVR